VTSAKKTWDSTGAFPLRGAKSLPDKNRGPFADRGAPQQNRRQQNESTNHRRAGGLEPEFPSLSLELPEGHAGRWLLQQEIWSPRFVASGA